MAKDKGKIVKCDKCHKPVKDTAAVEVNGKIKWLCYRCYKEQKE